MEYVVGPVIALLLGMKFTDWKAKTQAAAIADLDKRVELVQQTEAELPKKVMATVMPLAKAVQKINQEIGL